MICFVSGNNVCVGGLTNYVLAYEKKVKCTMISGFLGLHVGNTVCVIYDCPPALEIVLMFKNRVKEN